MKKNFKKTTQKKLQGFTLVEVLVAISIFTVVVLIATSILSDIVRTEKGSSVENPLYEDSVIILGQLKKEIKAGTIDYEEYYSVNVVQALQSPAAGSFNSAPQGGVDMPAGGPYYGINYGAYSSRFFDPGKSLDDKPTVNPDDLGIECSLPESLKAGEECEVYYNYSSDFNTGQNPYAKAGSDADEADAFCDGTVGKCSGDPAEKNIMDELYLIDSSGTKKTIIGRKKMNLDGDWAIGVVRMSGEDTDQNGVIDVFGCTEDFKCKDTLNEICKNIIKYPFEKDCEDTLLDPEDTSGSKSRFRLPQMSDRFIPFDINTTQFIPITPKRSTIKSLKFIINPIEDPYKAYAENAMRTHPSVTIILTLGLAKETAEDYPGDFEDLTVQATVAAGVIGKIDAYPPMNDVLSNSNDTSWLSDVLPAGVSK